MKIFNFLIMLLLISPSSFAMKQVKAKSFVVLVNQKNIFLSDLLDTEGLDAKTINNLKKVRLSRAPQVGERRIFTNVALSQVLRKKFQDSNIKVIIPKHVIVENPVQSISDDDIKSKLISSWKRLCPDCQFSFEQFSPPVIPKEFAKLEWSLQEVDQLPLGSFSRLIKVKKETEFLNFWVSGTVKISRLVPVLKRTLFVGQSIQPDDFEYRTRDITYLNNKTLPQEDAIVGKVLRMGLRSNDIIWLDTLARDSALKRGALVTVISGKDDWEVSLKAVAQQDGFVGDVINLINPETKKVISGKVIGVNKVMLL